MSRLLRPTVAFTLILLLLATVPGSPALARSFAAGSAPAPASGLRAAHPRLSVSRAQTEAAARQAAVAWLHTQQLPDGGFGDAPGSVATPRSNASATADAVYTLARLGDDPAGKAWTVGGRGPLDALAALAPAYAKADAGQAGKVARAVALAGANPRAFAGLNVIALIEAAYNPATGRYNPDLLFRHTLALEAEAAAGGAPAAAFDALLSARLSDGSWFWSFDARTGDTDTTGRVMQVLAAYAGMRCAPFFAPTLAYFSAQQTHAGWSTGTQPGPANANSTALVVSALRAAGMDPGAFRQPAGGPSALAALLAFQEASGAFVFTLDPSRQESRLIATLDALDALATPEDGSEFCRPVYLPLPAAGEAP